MGQTSTTRGYLSQRYGRNYRRVFATPASLHGEVFVTAQLNRARVPCARAPCVSAEMR
jgi:hypothetical protein